MTAADHANTVRDALHEALLLLTGIDYEEGSRVDRAVTGIESLKPALDALQHQAETAEALQDEKDSHGVYVTLETAEALRAERDAAVQAAETLHREIAEDYVLAAAYHEQRVRAEAAEQAAEQAHAALQRIADEGDNNPPHAVVDIARAALAGNQPPRDSGKPQSHP